MQNLSPRKRFACPKHGTHFVNTCAEARLGRNRELTITKIHAGNVDGLYKQSNWKDIFEVESEGYSKHLKRRDA